MSTFKVFISVSVFLAVAAATCLAHAATPAAPGKPRTPASWASWVVIHTKGQKFQFGQEFPGRRWTYTFPCMRFPSPTIS